MRGLGKLVIERPRFYTGTQKEGPITREERGGGWKEEGHGGVQKPVLGVSMHAGFFIEKGGECFIVLCC